MHTLQQKSFPCGIKKNDFSNKSFLGWRNFNYNEYTVKRGHISYLHPANRNNVYVKGAASANLVWAKEGNMFIPCFFYLLCCILNKLTWSSSNTPFLWTSMCVGVERSKKNQGSGKVLVVRRACLHAKTCPTLRDPTDCNPAGSSTHWILQARLLERVAISFSKGSSRPRDRAHISHVTPIGRRMLSHCATWATVFKKKKSFFLRKSEV